MADSRPSEGQEGRVAHAVIAKLGDELHPGPAGRGRNGGYRPTPLAPTATTLSVVSLYSREGREPGPEQSTMPGAIQRLDRELSETHRRYLSGITIASLVAEVKAEREELTYSI